MIKVKGLENYYGGKGGSGTYQTIINYIPPHDIYIEPFLGSGVIMRYKLPAPLNNIGIDLDAQVTYLWNQTIKEQQLTSFDITDGDGIEFLLKLKTGKINFPGWAKVFIYLDPPYIKKSRKSENDVYPFEMDDISHVQILDIISDINKQKIAISCYENDLYKKKLKDWNCIKFNSTTRHGTATEFLYMNYENPEKLHDYRYLGIDFRERERIKNKILRHVARLKRLPVLERNAILNAFRELS